MKKNIAKKLELKKVVVKKMNVKTGIKGGTWTLGCGSNNSCTGASCRTN